jgi:pseudouridine-5'-phosphate glycosidase
MAQTNVAVVSAGVKSILDIGLTLEYLETVGIPVVTVGSDEFPSFYSRESGYRSPLRMDDPVAIADMLQTKWSMGLSGSVLIANPLSQEASIDRHEMEAHIQAALTAAEQVGVKGKEVTPFLLKYIAAHTSGESLEANMALIKSNAALGARIGLVL